MHDKIQGYNVWVAGVTEVEIDVLTGEKRVIRCNNAYPKSQRLLVKIWDMDTHAKYLLPQDRHSWRHGCLPVTSCGCGTDWGLLPIWFGIMDIREGCAPSPHWQAAHGWYLGIKNYKSMTKKSQICSDEPFFVELQASHCLRHSWGDEREYDRGRQVERSFELKRNGRTSCPSWSHRRLSHSPRHHGSQERPGHRRWLDQSG